MLTMADSPFRRSHQHRTFQDCESTDWNVYRSLDNIGRQRSRVFSLAVNCSLDRNNELFFSAAGLSAPACLTKSAVSCREGKRKARLLSRRDAVRE